MNIPNLVLPDTTLATINGALASILLQEAATENAVSQVETKLDTLITNLDAFDTQNDASLAAVVAAVEAFDTQNATDLAAVVAAVQAFDTQNATDLAALVTELQKHRANGGSQVIAEGDNVDDQTFRALLVLEDGTTFVELTATDIDDVNKSGDAGDDTVFNAGAIIESDDGITEVEPNTGSVLGYRI